MPSGPLTSIDTHEKPSHPANVETGEDVDVPSAAHVDARKNARKYTLAELKKMETSLVEDRQNFDHSILPDCLQLRHCLDRMEVDE